jgi:hypothetical protein
MNTSVRTATATLARLKPTRGELLVGALLVNTEALAVAVYLSVANVTATALTPYVVPFVWLNVGLWALARVRFPEVGRRRTAAAAAVGVAYFLLLAWVGGLVGFTGSGTGFRIAWLPPGWGPALLYQASAFSLALVPYRIVGYAILAYLLAAAALDATSGVLGGIVGLFSCVSCTLPVIATVLSSTLGASAATAFAAGHSYELSTAVFVLTVGLLAWRPSAGFGR